MITFEVPNLDCLSSAELEDLASVFQALHRYAEKKSAAIRDRRYGCIQDAMQKEHALESVYYNLPHWAKW
jgi:hypothetical protein